MKIAGKGADGTIRVPSRKALVELLDKFLLAVYRIKQNMKIKVAVINVDDSCHDELGGSAAKSNLENRYSPEESGELEGIDSTGIEDKDDANESADVDTSSQSNFVPDTYFFKLILVFAIVGPLSNEPADLNKIDTTIMKEEFAVVKNVTEMSADALKIASKNEKESCESISGKKIKLESHVIEKNKLLKESVQNQKLQTQSLQQLNESIISDALIYRAQVLKINIDVDILSMQRDGDDKNSPVRYQLLKAKRKAASAALETLLESSSDDAMFTTPF